MRLHEAAFYGAVFILSGILIGVGGGRMLPVIVLVGAMIGWIWLLTFLNNRGTMFSIRLMVLAVLVIPGFLFGARYYKSQEEIYPDFNQTISLTGTVGQEPIFKGNSLAFNLNLDEPYRGEARVYTDIFSPVRAGDRIEVVGILKANSYGGAMMSWPDIEVVKFNKRGSGLKESLVGNLRKFLPEKEGALAAGILLGERRFFSETFKENLNKSGTTHIVALSGYNITILVIIAGICFGSFLPRAMAWIATVAAIIGFVILVGGEASIVRAAIMGIIGLLAIRFDRLYSPRNAIAITALAMALYNPGTLFEPGFQLSFLALLGIIYLLPAIKNILPVKWRASGWLSWREHLLTTAAAQAAVAPVAFYHFQSFSIASFLPNVLILEFIPMAMLFSFLTAVGNLFSFGGNALSWLAAWPAFLILKYQTMVIDFFAARSWLVKIETFNVTAGVIYYALLAVFIYCFFNYQPKR